VTPRSSLGRHVRRAARRRERHAAFTYRFDLPAVAYS
jgi:hypothetical protein